MPVDNCQRLLQSRSSEYVRDALLRSADFARLARDLSIAGSYLRHWIVLAFRDAIGRSETVTALAAGWVTVPDLFEIVEEQDVGSASWLTLIDDVDRRIERLMEVLRSDDLRTEASQAFDHSILTVRRFPSLGDVSIEKRLP